MSAYHYSPNTVDRQALWYAQRVSRSGSTVLTFFPKKKSPEAHSNRFRRRVLELLLCKTKPHAERAGAWLTSLEKYASELGFTITEVDPSDYPE